MKKIWKKVDGAATNYVTKNPVNFNKLICSCSWRHALMCNEKTEKIFSMAIKLMRNFPVIVAIFVYANKFFLCYKTSHAGEKIKFCDMDDKLVNLHIIKNMGKHSKRARVLILWIYLWPSESPTDFTSRSSNVKIPDWLSWVRSWEVFLCGNELSFNIELKKKLILWILKDIKFLVNWKFKLHAFSL